MGDQRRGAAAVGQLEVQPPVTSVDHPLTYAEAAARLEGPGRSYLERLDEAISTDLNTAQALAVLTRVSRDDEIRRDALGAAFEAVLAFGLLDPEPKDIEPSARKLLLAPDEIDQLLGEREDARRRGDLAVADQIRDMLERLGIEVRDTPRGSRRPISDSAAPPGLDRRASHEDQIVNLGLMATDFPQYRLSFDRPGQASRSTRVTGPDPDAAHGSGACFEPEAAGTPTAPRQPPAANLSG